MLPCFFSQTYLRLFNGADFPKALVFVIAQAGGALFPAITGLIASKAGVGVLQPILIGLIIAMGASWALVPKVEHKED